MIEYMAWYEPGTTLVRCGGDDGCGALLVNGDTELHTSWHNRLTRMFDAAGVTIKYRGTW